MSEIGHYSSLACLCGRSGRTSRPKASHTRHILAEAGVFLLGLNPMLEGLNEVILLCVVSPLGGTVSVNLFEHTLGSPMGEVVLFVVDDAVLFHLVIAGCVNQYATGHSNFKNIFNVLFSRHCEPLCYCRIRYDLHSRNPRHHRHRRRGLNLCRPPSRVRVPSRIVANEAEGLTANSQAEQSLAIHLTTLSVGSLENNTFRPLKNRK